MKRYFVFLCCLITSLFFLNALAANDRSFSHQQVKDIQKIVYNYLTTNPEVLVKASQVLQKKQEKKLQQDALSAIKTHKKQIFSDINSPTVGNPKSSIKVVEFFDYQCGHCKAMAPIITTAIKNNARIKVIFKDLPIFGGNSRYAAKAALASVKQGKYYKFHNALFAATTPLSPKTIFKIAKKVGLNTNTLKQDMNAKWIDQQLRANFQLAQKLKLVGTPAFIVSNNNQTEVRFIPGAISQKDFNQQVADVSAQ